MIFSYILLLSQCPRVPLDKLADMSNLQIADMMRQPIIITNGMNQWNNMSIYTFDKEFGSHKILARRTHFASHLDGDTFGTYMERSEKHKAKVQDVPHVSVSDFLLHSSSEHIILFDNEPGMSMEEELLLNSIRKLRKTPDVLSRASETLFFSFGGGTTGVNVANHGFTWIGLLRGRKLWYVAPPNVTKPNEPNCFRNITESESIPHSFKCLQYPGEIFVTPTAWWHATCNLDQYGIGIGGQDSCDLGCNYEAKKGGPFCANENMHYKCWNAETSHEEL